MSSVSTIFRRSAVAKNQSPRDALKAALAARASAEKAIAVARQNLERLQTVLTASDEARRAASNSARAADEARQRWVQSGCNLSTTREHHALAEAAAEASRTAEHAAADAKAVMPEFQRVQSALEEAQDDMRSREYEISAAIGAIIVAEEQPLLEKYALVADQLRSLRVELMALHGAVDAWRPHGAVAPSREGVALVAAALERGQILLWDRERDLTRVREWEPDRRDEAMDLFERCVSRWRARAAQLRADPES